MPGEENVIWHVGKETRVRAERRNIPICQLTRKLAHANIGNAKDMCYKNAKDMCYKLKRCF